MTPRPAYVVTVEALPDRDGGPPAMLRLRSWLKSGLRAHRLRCVRIEPCESPRRQAGEVQRQTPGQTLEAET